MRWLAAGLLASRLALPLLAAAPPDILLDAPPPRAPPDLHAVSRS